MTVFFDRINKINRIFSNKRILCPCYPVNPVKNNSFVSFVPLCENKKSGFTLIEVLIATMILSMGLLVLMTGLGNCAKMIVLAKEYQQSQYVFTLGELKYPVEETDDVEKDLVVPPDSSLVDKFTFERTVDEKVLAANEVDDELYTVRTIVSWGRGDNQREELVRYVRKGKKK